MATPEEQPPFPMPCLGRLSKLEATVIELRIELAAIRMAQDGHTAQIDAAAHKAAADLTEKMAEQNMAILKVSQSMLSLQQAIQRWAAAGTLAGAVVFFILAKVAGL